MNIVLLTGFYPKGWHLGGAEQQCLLLADYLGAKGHRVTFSVLKGERKKGGEKQNNFQVFIAGSFNENIFFSFYRLLIFLIKNKPDVLFIRDFRYLFWFVIIGKCLNIKIVFNTTHINNCYSKKRVAVNGVLKFFVLSPFIKIKQYLNFQSLKFINVVTINKLQVEILKRQGIKSVCIYNSMDDNYHLFQKAKEKNVVWVANIKARKRPELFIRLAEAFRNRGWRFIMIGNMHGGQFYSEMLDDAVKNNPDLYYFGGKTIKEVDEILASSMIMVNTCEPEGFGNNFIQAWLSECPTVTLEFDPDNIIEREGIGFLSHDTERMTENVRYLMDHPVICMSMGKKARKYALENHLIDINGEKYEKYFFDLVKLLNYEEDK